MQYSSSLFVDWGIHSIEPVGFPPSHAIWTELSSSFAFVSAFASISKESASLPPFAPHSPPSTLDSCKLSFASDGLESSLPKSSVTSHCPGDHGEGDVLCDDDDIGDDDNDSSDAKDVAVFGTIFILEDG